MPETRPDPRPLLLPAADAVQPNQPSQWWYWSGQLSERYGFQLSMFAGEAIRGLLWGQMAHWAIVELDSGTFISDSRIWLGAPKRVEGRFMLATRDGHASACGGDGRDRLCLRLPGFELDLRASGGPVMQHYDGRDHAYAFGGHSYYYSRPRMLGDGTLQTPRGTTEVRGEVWFDRQFGELSPALAEGWQWLSIHLDGGEQLMVFDFNRTPCERIAAITDAAGETRWLQPGAFELQAIDTWRSPRSHIEYPSAWRLQTDRHQLELRASLAAQEMNGPGWLGPVYWEGACEVSGSHSGRAYAELLGSLSDPLARWLRAERGPVLLREPIRRALLHPPVVLALATAIGWGASRLARLRPRFEPPRPEPTASGVFTLLRAATSSNHAWRGAVGQ